MSSALVISYYYYYLSILLFLVLGCIIIIYLYQLGTGDIHTGQSLYGVFTHNQGNLELTNIAVQLM